ncbi:MAG: DUF4230 domain-containing protein [Lachnospiraceae bacterium]|nr:DUF4230 domain-containing protein [Lachnospiraceae bacterium]
MKKILIFSLLSLMSLSLVACGKKEEPKVNTEPQITQMQAICELAVMECYYHNVAKYYEEDASGVWIWAKDKKFWIEYSGIVTIGVDATLVTMEVEDTNVTITIPEAKVLECEVDADTLNENSFIIDDDSAKITAEDQTYAFAEAQAHLEETASNDTALLTEARERTKDLLEEYVNNIGEAFGIEYTITWVYLDENGNSGQTEE